MYLSIVIPLYNEEDSIPNLLSKLREACSCFRFSYEVILVDDGSEDRTWEVINQYKNVISNLRAIRFRGNYGQTYAMVAGFDHAEGEVIVTMDGDLQNDPGDIPALIEKLNEGYDIVSGWRKDRKDSFARVLPSKIANGIISYTTGTKLHDYGCSLKAYRSDCIKSLKAYGEMHRFFPALSSMTGARVTEIPVNHFPRQFGYSKYGFDRILKVFSDIFAMNMIIRFSTTPLRGFALCSLPFILLFLFFGWFAFAAAFFDWTEGKPMFFTIAAALNAMAAVHLLVLGILGELVVGTSDLSHTQMLNITKKVIDFRNISDEGLK